MITKETRLESYRTLNRDSRYKEIISVLEHVEEGLTAREIADKLHYVERNAVAPRLTELCGLGIVEAIDKRKDKVTNKTVAVYVLKKESKVNKINRTCDCIEKCVNCKYGYLEYKDKKERNIEKVYCKKYSFYLDKRAYNDMKFCLFFEKKIEASNSNTKASTQSNV